MSLELEKEDGKPDELETGLGKKGIVNPVLWINEEKFEDKENYVEGLTAILVGYFAMSYLGDHGQTRERATEVLRFGSFSGRAASTEEAFGRGPEYLPVQVVYVEKKGELPREVVLCVIEEKEEMVMGVFIREALDKDLREDGRTAGWKFREWEYRWTEDREDGSLRRGIAEALFGD